MFKALEKKRLEAEARLAARQAQDNGQLSAITPQQQQLQQLQQQQLQQLQQQQLQQQRQLQPVVFQGAVIPPPPTGFGLNNSNSNNIRQVQTQYNRPSSSSSSSSSSFSSYSPLSAATTTATNNTPTSTGPSVFPKAASPANAINTSGQQRSMLFNTPTRTPTNPSSAANSLSQSNVQMYNTGIRSQDIAENEYIQYVTLLNDTGVVYHTLKKLFA